MGSSPSMSEQTLSFIMHSFITFVEQKVYGLHRHKMSPHFSQKLFSILQTETAEKSHTVTVKYRLFLRAKDLVFTHNPHCVEWWIFATSIVSWYLENSSIIWSMRCDNRFDKTRSRLTCMKKLTSIPLCLKKKQCLGAVGDWNILSFWM